MSSRPPRYSRQKEKGRSDRAYVWIAGKKVMLGKFGSPESRAKFAEVVAASVAEADQVVEPTTNPTVGELMVAYLEYAKRYYRRPDGTDGREYEISIDAFRFVRREAETLSAIEFGPLRLKAVRQAMIDADLSRKFINKQIDRIRRMFKWAAAEEMIPGRVPQDLSMVAGLKKGRTDARETEPVRPVAMDVVDATLVELPEVLADMVRVQLLTGMRPGELITLRPQDIDRDGQVWHYSIGQHKTTHHGHRRTVAIGPQAQAILLRYLARAGDAPMFQPRDSEAKRRAALEATRTTPLSCGNRRGTNRKADPKRQPGSQYTVDAYRHAIQRAARHAGVEKWSPHRLRHSAGTVVRKRFGLDASQAVLGHCHAQITEVYAELNQEKADAVALKIG